MNPKEPRGEIDEWRDDERVLAEIGKELSKQRTRMEVLIPKNLALQALASWEREYEPTDALSVDGEKSEDRKTRERSGTLALIGLCVENGFTIADDGSYVVEVDAWQIGDALAAADEMGLL